MRLISIYQNYFMMRSWIFFIWQLLYNCQRLESNNYHTPSYKHICIFKCEGLSLAKLFFLLIFFIYLGPTQSSVTYSHISKSYLDICFLANDQMIKHPFFVGINFNNTLLLNTTMPILFWNNCG